MMSVEKIQELDKRLSMQEVTVTRVLEAVEKQANSTDRLTESVIKMTASFDFVISEIDEIKIAVENVKNTSANNSTEIKIIKNATRWMDWAGRAIVLGLVAAIFYAIKIMP